MGKQVLQRPPPQSNEAAKGGAAAAALSRARNEALHMTDGYNLPLLNSLVLYIGTQAIAQLQSKPGSDGNAFTVNHSAPMDIFQHLATDLDPRGRYLLLNAIANQLRFPNNHTHYFSCVMLYLFVEAKQELIQEQITRVLLERLIVHRPHPWGLLITFIELIKNRRYEFWNHSFVKCAPEVEKLFESVAHTCLGTTGGEGPSGAPSIGGVAPVARPASAPR